ncbi:hypothetical protein [Siccibacter colletis]|uniref:Uncharacterized protein n=1 Tax=Siccibacter colletis TaxID=1505757 RepID=A0ABY6J935_9ENTR|nr:hypothetical protein [Siccibacter colletis]UYU30360.1 hypothetical protein KFZ77_10650 [Siccibacter colletis]
MSVQQRHYCAREMCQPREAQEKSESAESVVIPASWKLSAQQQAFIELFAEPDHKKQ